MMLERLSKLAVVLSACVAVLTGAWLGAREWALLLPLTIAALVGGIAAGRVWGTRAWGPVLVFAYIVPVIFLAVFGYMLPAYWMPWIAALLGGVMGNVQYGQWSFPPRWKWPLAYWALAVALVWPAVVAREADFSWALMSRYNLGNSGLGGPPPVIAVWVVSVALTHMLGLLWMDAFFAKLPFADRDKSLSIFTRDVVWPLAVSVGLGSAVAIYQGTVDVSWLSDHQWPVYNRASGGLLDGDAFGALAGFWVGAFLAVAACSRAATTRVIAILGACAACAGLWMTGSRMALLAALICLATALWFVVTARRWSVRQLAIGAVPAIGVVIVVGMLVTRSSTKSPTARVMESLPSTLSHGELRAFAVNELWNRFGPFGTASLDMAREYPLSGIGVGNFNHIFTDYAFMLTGSRAHKDNAQSWYRHQLAELGVLGSLGWLLWLPMFVAVAARTRGDRGSEFPAGMIKGALLAVAILSLVSMPTQPLPVAITVWVFAFWYLLLSGDAAARITMPWRLSGKAVWGLTAWGLALVFAGATLRSGWRDLRPPYRAIRADWTYQVGFYDVEQPAGQPAFRWTEQHAALVFPVTGAWLKLTVHGGPPDIASDPVTLEVRRRGKSILKEKRADLASQTWYVKAPSGEKRMMLEFDVSRTWRPSAPGSGGDERELGVAVDDWTFVAVPPPGAVVIR